MIIPLVVPRTPILPAIDVVVGPSSLVLFFTPTLLHFDTMALDF